MNVTFSSQPSAQIECDALVVAATPEFDGELAALDSQFEGTLVAELRERKFKGTAGSLHSFATLGRIKARNLIVVGVGSGSRADVAKAAGRAGREVRQRGATSVALAFGAVDVAHLLEAAAAGTYLWQAFKPEDERQPEIGSWTVLGGPIDSTSLAAASVRHKWQNWGRDLVNLPGADLYPESLAAKAQELAALPGVEVEVWDFERCRAEGCVGIVAVGQGSDRPGCLIHVRYRPEQAREHIALVGKGVTFDAGGLSLKPSSGMQTMRCDMGGSATMLAATGAIAELGVPINLDCFVGAVENMVSGNSYKLGDVLRYNNGVTVEIHNTDAEGRLVLADCLQLASQVPGVSRIVDAATLTGAAVVAVGSDFTALFTDDDALATELLDAAQTDDEGLWRMPLHAPYKEMLKSDFAQIKNVGGREAGSVTAALFLSHFVPKDGPRWAHLDIAGPAFLDKPNTRYAVGGTGQMVRSLTTWAASLVK